LHRCLGIVDLVVIGIGGMIGSGIYVMTGITAKEQAGNKCKLMLIFPILLNLFNENWPFEKCISVFVNRAIARILFQPRQSGKLGIWGLSPKQGPGSEPLVKGGGAKPRNAESFSLVGCPKEMKNVVQFYYFTTNMLFSKHVLSCIYTTMLW